ncbi:MAG: diguanylate cyclase [Clostridia bacterium]|nr:diguanylate cyclase [Clostridia bacterium]
MSFIYNDSIAKFKILIVDDSEMNRMLLTDMLEEEYEILEAEDGLQAIALLQKQDIDISLVLLDAVMPRMNGFEVLTVMNQKHWIEDIPVIMISAESGFSQVERAFELGVTDFITRPFDARIVHRRVDNTILLYAKQKKLIGLVAEQIYEKERHSNLMIDILSHIVEFRNGESGLHILHVRTLTELLLRHLVRRTDRYAIHPSDIILITTASALHDIGKIAIDERILNKPGKLTDEEFALMKTHSLVGAEMLSALPVYQDEPLLKKAYEICRWHHERYDGRGYPDGLSGDDIPLSAQIVALADVYDALTSDRVYKKAFSHEVAVQMILEGECGTFNPLLVDCLRDIAPHLESELKKNTQVLDNGREVWNTTQEMLLNDDLTSSHHTLWRLDWERTKYNFFATMAEEIQFEYTLSPPMLTISKWGAQKLNLDEIIVNPSQNEGIRKVLGLDVWKQISEMLRNSSPAQPVVSCECKLLCNGQTRWYRIITQAFWSTENPPQYMGAIGKALDIHDSQVRLEELEKRASHDNLTGLLNHTYAKQRIKEQISRSANGKFALVIFDLDHFKSANDNYGHIFGDQILKHMAEKLRQSTRSNDIVARVGGDEFLLFLEYSNEVEPIIKRIFSSITGVYEGFPISISMGIARTIVNGTDYESLFHAADQALYTAKRSGRGRYCFYNESMKMMLSAISPIDSNETIHSIDDGGGSLE